MKPQQVKNYTKRYEDWKRSRRLKVSSIHRAYDYHKKRGCRYVYDSVHKRGVILDPDGKRVCHNGLKTLLEGVSYFISNMRFIAIETRGKQAVSIEKTVTSFCVNTYTENHLEIFSIPSPTYLFFNFYLEPSGNKSKIRSTRFRAELSAIKATIESGYTIKGRYLGHKYSLAKGISVKPINTPKDSIYPRLSIPIASGLVIHVRMHRFAAAVKYGSEFFDKVINEKVVVRHRNDNREDFRLSNIEMGSQKDNMRDKVGKPYKKLTRTEQEEIFTMVTLRTKSYQDIADEYGISYQRLIASKKSLMYKRFLDKHEETKALNQS